MVRIFMARSLWTAVGPGGPRVDLAWLLTFSLLSCRAVAKSFRSQKCSWPFPVDPVPPLLKRINTCHRKKRPSPLSFRLRPWEIGKGLKYKSLD